MPPTRTAWYDGYELSTWLYVPNMDKKNISKMAVASLIASSITVSRLNWLLKATTQVMLLPSVKQIMEYHQ